MTQRLLISDANILIDMEKGGITRQMFQLDAMFAVPNMLYEEELRADHPELPALGLQSFELSAKTVAYAEKLIVKHSHTGASINDLLALALAWQEKTALLTGDGKLRIAAAAEKIPFYGTLWLVEQLINAKILTVKQAAAAYAKMKATGRWLPWDRVERQLRIHGE